MKSEKKGKKYRKKGNNRKEMMHIFGKPFLEMTESISVPI